MTAATVFPDLVGKRVELTYASDGDTLTETGTVKVANSTGVMFQKGQKIAFILNHEIQDARLVDSPAKSTAPAEIKAKRLDPVTDNTVKRHLALHHATLLSVVNRLSIPDALQLHDMQHEEAGEDAPHYHADKNDTTV